MPEILIKQIWLKDDIIILYKKSGIANWVGQTRDTVTQYNSWEKDTLQRDKVKHIQKEQRGRGKLLTKEKEAYIGHTTEQFGRI